MLGESFGTVVSYLKGALILLQKYGGLPTHTMGLINDIVCLAECSGFSDFMKIIYFNHKRKTDEIEYTTYIGLTESEYRTFYQGQKWKNQNQIRLLISTPTSPIPGVMDLINQDMVIQVCVDVDAVAEVLVAILTATPVENKTTMHATAGFQEEKPKDKE